MLKLVSKITVTVISVIVIVLGVLYSNNDIGILKSSIEDDARASQKIGKEWLVQKDISDSTSALIFYPEDKSDYTFSVYVNRPGLSFGYFFRGGGDIVEVDKYIGEFTVEGYNERAFISMNSQKVERLEIDDGNCVQTINIDSDKPFSFVFPENIGNIVFYDVDDNVVKTLKNIL